MTIFASGPERQIQQFDWFLSGLELAGSKETHASNLAKFCYFVTILILQQYYTTRIKQIRHYFTNSSNKITYILVTDWRFTSLRNKQLQTATHTSTNTSIVILRSKILQ